MSNLRAGILLLVGILLVTGAASLIVFLNERREEAVQEQLATAQRALDEGDLDGAVAAWETVLEKDPEHRDAALDLFDTIAWFDPERAQSEMERLRAMPLDAERRLYRETRLALLEEDLEAARALVAELEKHQPLELEGNMARLLLYFAEGDGEQALPLLNELESTWPADRQLRFITSEVLSVQQVPLERVRAKDGFMRLMERTDEWSFRAAVDLVIPNNLPLYPEDREAAVAHLREHPWRERGLARLPEPVQEGLVHTMEGTAPLIDLDEVEDLLAAPPVSGQAEDTENADRVYAVLRRAADAQLNRMEKADQVRLMELLRAHPLADLPTRLNAARVLMELQPERKEALVREVLTASNLSGQTEDTENSEEDFLVMGRWLLRIGEAAEALQLLGEDEALETVELLALRFDTLMALEKYDEAAALVEAGEAILAEWQEDILRIHAHIAKREFGTARRLVEGIVGIVPPAQLFQAAALARETGSERLQRVAYDRAWEAGLAFPRREAMTYLATLLEEADLDGALRFTAYCRTLEPTEPIYINNHTYMQLVAGRGIDAAMVDMRELVEKHPKFQPFRLTLAMAELLGGYPGRARETLEGIGDSPALEDARSKLSMALVLAGSGEHDKAGELVDSIDIATLMNAEQDLLDLYLRDGTF